MPAVASIDAIEWLRKQIEESAPDPLRTMLVEMVNLLMSAEVDAVCNAGYRERSGERANSRNGYRERASDTRVGTIGLQIPKLRQGSYFPTWLLEPRRAAEVFYNQNRSHSALDYVSPAEYERTARMSQVA